MSRVLTLQGAPCLQLWEEHRALTCKRACWSAHSWLARVTERQIRCVEPVTEPELPATGISDHDLLFSQPDQPARASADGYAALQRRPQQPEPPRLGGTPARRRAQERAANTGEPPSCSCIIARAVPCDTASTECVPCWCKLPIVLPSGGHTVATAGSTYLCILNTLPPWRWCRATLTALADWSGGGDISVMFANALSLNGASTGRPATAAIVVPAAQAASTPHAACSELPSQCEAARQCLVAPSAASVMY